MGLSSYDMLKFTREEKKEIRQALNNVLDDLDALWDVSSLESVYQYFDLKGQSWGCDEWELIIDKNGILIKDYPKEIVLETFGRRNKRPRVKDYTEIYYFIRQYETLRKKVEDKIKRSNIDKNKGIDEIINIKNRYTKEATIEVEVPETINPHTITLKQEDGKSVGEIRMNAGTIRIITRGSIVIDKQEFDQPKVKKR